MFPAASLTFEMFQQRLLALARRRLANGEFTERGLARLVGISQPHIHHVLKGQRTLTPEVGDALLATLEISLFDLLSDDELGQTLVDRHGVHGGRQHLPVLAGRLGPDDPFPDSRAVTRWLRPSSEIWWRGWHPALVECAPDAELPSPWNAGVFALLDQDERERVRPALPCWYALRWRGAGFLRQLRRERDGLRILSQTSFESSPLPARIQLSDTSLLHVVRARLLWWGVDPRQADDLVQSSGEWLPDPPASA